MNTSRTSFLSEVFEGLKGKRIPQSRLVYLRARLRNRIYDLIASEFLRQHGKKVDLASRIGRDPAQITRWLSSPSNWTLDTISDLMAAMGTEPEFSVAVLSEKKKARDEPVHRALKPDNVLVEKLNALPIPHGQFFALTLPLVVGQGGTQANTVFPRISVPNPSFTKLEPPEGATLDFETVLKSKRPYERRDTEINIAQPPARS
jgi:hypothetical protein